MTNPISKVVVIPNEGETIDMHHVQDVLEMHQLILVLPKEMTQVQGEMANRDRATQVEHHVDEMIDPDISFVSVEIVSKVDHGGFEVQRAMSTTREAARHGKVRQITVRKIWTWATRKNHEKPVLGKEGLMSKNMKSPTIV